MKRLRPSDFAAFFGEVYKDSSGKPLEPFPWQQRLAERVCEGDWPECIALPTAAGKTACIDIAVFALACQAHLPPQERTAPRRIFFVVDRRVVVDQAFLHARELAEILDKAETGIVKQIADALRELAGGIADHRPLDCYALRGGMYRDNAWVRSPLQPTVITSTVDQVGSRLLFRGYGVSDTSKPLHAAMVGNDALILLDEAHCSRPFAQTVESVARYRQWAEERISLPFQFVTMSATPPENVIEREERRKRERPEVPSLIFGMNEDDRNHPTLGARISMHKPARLVVAEKAKGKRWRQALVTEMAKHARALAERYASVGIIVNRVATARELAKELDAVLVTGRMRPLDRDRLFQHHLEPLLSNKPGSPPQYVVATQCLEVGADFDFHALVTECASLDALRQRFGRLNRVAARQEGEAVIVIRANQTDPAPDESDADPVYGNSIANTWKWLNQNAVDGVFDFGVASVQSLTDEMTTETLTQLNAPAPDAAVLLPAHLDLWCQTSPRPEPDPDPAPFLHGPSRGVPNVQVVFRADLGNDVNLWKNIVALCPPSSAEALPVRIDVFKKWLTSTEIIDDSSDVESEVVPAGEELDHIAQQVLLWRGPDSKDTRVVTSLKNIQPNQTYVLPITDDVDYSGLGDFLPASSTEENDAATAPQPTDLGDEAFQRARDYAILRSTTIPALKDLTLDDEDFEEKLDQALTSLLDDPRKWVQTAARNLCDARRRIVKVHPAGGIIIMGRRRLNLNKGLVAVEETWQSSSSTPVLLEEHNTAVSAQARLYAEKAGADPRYVDTVALAGKYHDTGKADSRFQALLHGGNRRRLWGYPHLIAKSIVSMVTANDREEARKRAGLPKHFRHEMLSLQLVEQCIDVPLKPIERDLLLHLIGSHHGHGRPLAPIVVDDDLPPAVQYNGWSLSQDTRQAFISPHRLDSGVAERFWSLTRRFGWWGLTFFESMLRLADWAVSDEAERKASR